MPSKKRRLAQLEGEKKKTAKTPSSSFFSELWGEISTRSGFFLQ
jgi:hypothetical protein